jgi:hypothetical protein
VLIGCVLAQGQPLPKHIEPLYASNVPVPAPQSKKPRGVPKFESPYGLKPFTAFPELRLPLPLTGQIPAPIRTEEDYQNQSRVWEDYQKNQSRVWGDYQKKLTKRLTAGFPRPIPADAPLLTKVRTAQVNEGAAYLLQTFEVIMVGRWTPQDFYNLVKVMNDVYRVAAELETDPVEKVAVLSEQVLMFRDAERFTQARAEAGADSPQQLNMARFYRLQAEADLIQAKERLGVK